MCRSKFAIAAVLMAGAITLAPTTSQAARTETGAVATPRVGRTVAMVNIPAIGLSVALVYGITDAALARGLGLWPGTAMPGKPGNAVVAGHRTSHGAPMRDIDKLKIGDNIFVTTSGKKSIVHRYRITRKQIVKPDAMWITRPTKSAMLTIFACHPPHSIAYRYVIFAKLVGRSGVGNT